MFTPANPVLDRTQRLSRTWLPFQEPVRHSRLQPSLVPLGSEKHTQYRRAMDAHSHTQKRQSEHEALTASIKKSERYPPEPGADDSPASWLVLELRHAGR
jgi:hypothetical protein